MTRSQLCKKTTLHFPLWIVHLGHGQKSGIRGQNLGIRRSLVDHPTLIPWKPSFWDDRLGKGLLLLAMVSINGKIVSHCPRRNAAANGMWIRLTVAAGDPRRPPRTFLSRICSVHVKVKASISKSLHSILFNPLPNQLFSTLVPLRRATLRVRAL